MKKIYKTFQLLRFFFISSTFILTSCEKFVDIERTSSQRLIETANDAQLILDNYSIMNINYPADLEVSADDYFVNESGFLSQAQINRDLYIWSPTALRTPEQWQNPYQVAYYANVALETVQKLKDADNVQDLNNIRGQGLFFRSYAFYQVAIQYANVYTESSADSDPGVPIRLTSDINEKSSRSSLRNTYNKIINDLNEATGLLSSTIVVASRPSKSAAFALLARIYLSMGDYNNALQSANNALEIYSELLDYNTLSLTSNNPFGRFNKEVLFHSVMRSVPILNPGSQSSNVAKISPELIAMYETDDLRLRLFFKLNTGSNAGTYRFTGNYESTTSATQFNGLTTDELYLIRAESYARLGQIQNAMDNLNHLLKTRWVTGTYLDKSASTADEALDIILKERRKELVMRGQRWNDLRRLNKDARFAKILTRSINGNTYTLPPNDLRYTLLIPTGVINNSDFSIFQNPR